MFKTAVREALMPEDENANMPSLAATILDELRESRRIRRLILAGLREIEETLRHMATDAGHMATDLRLLVADSLERRLWYALPSELRIRRDVRDMSVLVYPAREEVVTPDFLHSIGVAQVSEAITEDERERALETDMIIAELGDDGMWTRFFAAVASSAICSEDIDRAVRTAEILERVHGLSVVPVAFGYRVDDSVGRYNDQEGRGRVWIIAPDGNQVPGDPGQGPRQR